MVHSWYSRHHFNDNCHISSVAEIQLLWKVSYHFSVLYPLAHQAEAQKCIWPNKLLFEVVVVLPWHYAYSLLSHSVRLWILHRYSPSIELCDCKELVKAIVKDWGKWWSVQFLNDSFPKPAGTGWTKAWEFRITGAELNTQQKHGVMMPTVMFLPRDW